MTKENSEQLNEAFMDAVREDKDATSIYKQFRMVMALGMTSSEDKPDQINFAKLFLNAQREVEKGGFREEVDPDRQEMNDLSREIYEADFGGGDDD